MSPQVVAAAVGAAIYTGAAVATGFIASGAAAAFFATTFLASVAVAVVGSVLAPDQKMPRIAGMKGRDAMVKQPSAPRTIVYGSAKVSGPVIFLATTGKSEFLHIIVALGAHEFESIDLVYFNDNKLTLGSADSRNAQEVTTEQYSGKAFLSKSLGTSAGNDFGLLRTAMPFSWTTSHKLTNVPAIYARLVYDQEAFPTSIPQLSAEVKGKKIKDTRTGSTAFSANPALVLHDYLTDTDFGLGCASTEINTTSFNTAANVCDEDVTLADGTTEKRYTANGVVSTSDTPEQIIGNILSSMGGTLTYTNGQFVVKAAAFISASDTLTDDDFIGAIAIGTKTSRRDTFNGVKGQWIGEDTNWQVTDYPAVTSSAFQTEDGGDQIFTELPLPFTNSSPMAQRLAKIHLFRGRQNITLSGRMKLTAFKYDIGDTIQLTIERFGFSAKIFEIKSWGLSVDDDGAMGIDVQLQETASTVYDFTASTEEQAYTQDNTTLRSVFDILPVGISVTDELRLQNETPITAVIIDITSSDFLVNEFEVGIKKNTDTNYISLGRSTNSRFEFIGALDGEVYNIRARGLNSAGGISAFTTVNHQIVGGTAIPEDVTNFSVNIIGREAHLQWTPVTDLDLSHYQVRHSSATSGAAFSTSQIFARKISRPANTAVVPAQTGTYLIKAFDKGGRQSQNATTTVAIVNEIGQGNLVSTITESPSFNGTKSDVVVVDSALQLDTTILFDAGLSGTGNFDDALGLFDGGSSSVDNEGTYSFVGATGDASVDLGAKFTSRVTAVLATDRRDYVDLFDSADGNFDDKSGLFEGDTAPSDVNVKLQVATTDGDPSGSPSYTDFRDFVIGDYSCRAFKFRAVLSSESTNSTPTVTQLQVVVDMPDRLTFGEDIASGTDAGGKDVTFSPAFKQLDSLALTAQNLASGDFYVISSKSATGFTVLFKNSSGSVVDRTFDFTAKGFGEVIT
jgi:hypothetical protein